MWVLCTVLAGPYTYRRGSDRRCTPRFVDSGTVGVGGDWRPEAAGSSMVLKDTASQSRVV